jgi:hypothetical protein
LPRDRTSHESVGGKFEAVLKGHERGTRPVGGSRAEKANVKNGPSPLRDDRNETEPPPTKDPLGPNSSIDKQRFADP